MSDQSLQDTGVFADFKCTGGCKTGVLLRAEKTPTGMKGVYVALAGEDLGSYAVTLDASGKEMSRERLRWASKQFGSLRRRQPPTLRAALAAVEAAPAGAGRAGGGQAAGASQVTLPVMPNPTAQGR